MHSLTMKALVVLAATIPPSFTPALNAQHDNLQILATQAAGELPPQELLSTATRDLLEIASHHRAEHDPASLEPPAASLSNAVEARIRSLFAIDTMTKLVLGRSWRQASPEQQQALVAEFGRLLVQTCVSALANAHQPAITFKQLTPVPGDDGVTVRSFVTRPGSKPWTIDYDMEKTPAGWKVVDIKMDGLRLITIHRDAFAELVRDDGIDGLLSSLAAWNQRSELPAADSRQHLPAALILMHIATQRGFIGGG
ncbi:phospholipid-binding protein MlaC [Dechloromonas denitrificans]|uniref:MlaC/ttg2D family ABC transporter substrate-binding protein n=1 Tax=Dechloromonas denitrificans TaxID=281362 RepID=UPI001CF9848F|nr:ABC transporter substrate-binding protein [Dechloromonas denitrificans]UCV07154.1 ABC transporter substrate-binding protein [Dechloromonas denitrificans]